MSDEEIAAIRVRADAAHPGEWLYRRGTQVVALSTESLGSQLICELDNGGDIPGELKCATAEFIAAARTDVPDLVDSHLQATARIAELDERVFSLEAEQERLRHGCSTQRRRAEDAELRVAQLERQLRNRR